MRGVYVLTSEERRAGRRARREMRRRKKKDEILKEHGHMDAVSDFGHLLEAADRSAKMCAGSAVSSDMKQACCGKHTKHT